MMRVFAPGKLILSGEHSVVYGQPALAMAVNRYVVASADSQLLPLISFSLSDLSYERGLTLQALKRLKSRIKSKYQRFISGDFTIREVLQQPVELAQFAFSLFQEALNIKLTQGIKIHIQSDIPMGCGMGSSAATILSIIHAIAHHLKMDMASDWYYRLGLEAENMQHGYSSGLDLRVSLYGGCIYVKNNEITTRTVPTMPLYIVNTGVPQTSTGECVSVAAKYFKHSDIAKDFGAVTDAFDAALQNNQLHAMRCAIRENHRLLSSIDVVPQRVQQFITDVEALDGAAKICGAGAVSGDHAGIVLVITDQLEALEKLCATYHYSMLPIRGESRGVHVI
jgi:mevalonate kinase